MSGSVMQFSDNAKKRVSWVTKNGYSQEIDVIMSRLHSKNLSRGTNAFGLFWLALQLIELWKLSGELPILSVGAGSGLLEALTMLINPSVQIISVDPLEEGDFYLLPTFKNVDSLLSETGEQYLGKCIVSLIWVDPSAGPYDMDAIEKLHPISVFCVHESDGAGGSEDFHQWRGSDEQKGEYPHSREVTTVIPVFDPFINRHMRLSLLVLSKNEVFGGDEEIKSPYWMDENEMRYQIMIRAMMESRLKR